MNPFGENRTMHSPWPIILAMYNLSTWFCHEKKYLMLSILIQGPKQAGIDIDVFLEPLMEDMEKLWNEGVRMWD
jgi:protein tyrosine phosphatase